MAVKSKFQDILHSFSLSELIELVRHKAQMETESTMESARKHLSALAHAVGIGSEEKPKRAAKGGKSTTPSKAKAKGKGVQAGPATQAALNVSAKKKGGKPKAKKTTSRKAEAADKK